MHLTLISALYHFQTFITTLILSTHAQKDAMNSFELHVRAQTLDVGTARLLHVGVARNLELP
jgi:hypothetical protein